MKVFGLLIISTTFFLGATAIGFTQYTPNAITLKTVPATSVFSDNQTNSDFTQKTVENNLQAPSLDNTSTSNFDEADQQTSSPIKILSAGDYDAAYSAYYSGQYKKAFEEAKKRASIGDPAAMTLIGKLHMEGRAVEQNSETAAIWFKRAADLGDPHAALYYGVNVFNGITIESDKIAGAKYIKQAAEAGVPQAYSYYAQILMNEASETDKYDIGLVWFLKGAVAGDPYSTYSAAELLAAGTASIKPNEYAARALLESAANAGNVAAQLELALWMYDGRGGDKNPKEAFTLIKLVALNNVPSAQVILARFYFEGIGTVKDPILGASWYLLAQQNSQGADDLDLLIKKLTPAQLQEAKARIEKLMINP